MKPSDPHWHSSAKAAHCVQNESAIDWDYESDVLVIGMGGAGAACALQALQHGLSVTALDRFAGGGATKASGGVIYAGGGTFIQKEAGVEDSPDNMFNYLKLETGTIVRDETLRRFCETSAETIDWMAENGAEFRPTLWEKKTSYPGPEYFLYHSDNSLVPSYRKHAAPAARGHRGFVPIEQGRKATNLGYSLYEPMKDAALAAGMQFTDHAEVEQLILGEDGAVLGAKALVFNSAEISAEYQRLRGKGQSLLAKWPPIMPGGKMVLKRAMKYLNAADELLSQRKAIYYRANKGVLLSAGGFAFNKDMMQHHAPKYTRGFPLGTDGDMGAGIRLGESAGGLAGNMDRVTAWRFINPPLNFARGMIVNEQGRRFIDEFVYGATLGVEMTEHHDGNAWLILTKSLVKQALADVSGGKALAFQRDLARLNVYFAAKKAKSLSDLASKIGLPADALTAQADKYSAAARGEEPDEFGKLADDMGDLGTGPFYAINIGLGARLYPCPVLTLGGLKVDEDTGNVLGEDGQHITGLYAAGRNAIGIASHNYISGLSIADGVFSGRRAARAMANQ